MVFFVMVMRLCANEDRKIKILLNTAKFFNLKSCIDCIFLDKEQWKQWRIF